MLTPSENSWTFDEAAHLINRAGFGGNPAEIKALHGLGRIAAVDSLLGADEPDSAFPAPAWSGREQALADMRMRAEQSRETQRTLRDATPENAERLRREARKEVQQEIRRRTLEAQGWWFRRIVRTRAPLREKMTLFWHDHFATSIQKVKQPVWMLWQNELFRRHAFGGFKQLAQAVLLDPAMMLYLDTQSSRKGKPNENFARELMELFTLGEGSYSERDIHEAARAFTGYQLNRGSGKVVHNRRQWDASDKTVFGQTGPFTGAEIIDLLFQQPAAARLLPSKLWAFFVAVNPPAALVDSLADTFRQADFNVAPLLRQIFLSHEFYAGSVVRDQIKSPIGFLVALLKQLEIADSPPGFPNLAQQQLGQVLFMPPNVAGWDWGKAWINTNTLLTRYNLAGLITKGAGDMASAVQGGKGKNARGPLAKGGRRNDRAWAGPNYRKIAPPRLRADPAALVDSLIRRFFQEPVAAHHRDTFIKYAASKAGGGFTDGEVAELCHLMLSTPEYQLC